MEYDGRVERAQETKPSAVRAPGTCNAAAGARLAAAVVVTAVTYKLVKQPAEAAEEP